MIGMEAQKRTVGEPMRIVMAFELIACMNFGLC